MLCALGLVIARLRSRWVAASLVIAGSKAVLLLITPLTTSNCRPA